MRPFAKSGFAPTLHASKNVVAGFVDQSLHSFNGAAHDHFSIVILSNASAVHEEASARLAFNDEASNEREKLVFVVLDNEAASVNGEFHGEEAKEGRDRSR